jgi:hypothetical protein
MFKTSDLTVGGRLHLGASIMAIFIYLSHMLGW